MCQYVLCRVYLVSRFVEVPLKNSSIFVGDKKVRG